MRMERAATEAIIRAAMREGVTVRLDSQEGLTDAIARAADLIVECVDGGHKVMFCGNGGSASDAQHIAAEFVGRYVMEREPLPALALHTDTSALTAIGNDYGFEQVYARQVRAMAQPGDVLVAITTSGTSPNILAAVKAAREKGLKVIGLTGAKGEAFAKDCDVGLAVPSRVTARVQEIHITIGHILCEIVDVSRAASAVVPDRAGVVSGSPKEMSRAELVALRKSLRDQKRTLVWTSGVFDVLHIGHLSSLRAARAFGDVLVVGVNDDASVKAFKGESRPIFPVAERVEMLAALGLVDYVHVFSEATPSEALQAIQPDVHCKGADYAPPAGKPIPEAAIVEAYGGRIAFLPLVPGRSSTSTLARILGEGGQG